MSASNCKLMDSLILIRLAMKIIYAILFFMFITSVCHAHDGRRFLVQVENDKLVAQGVNSEKIMRFNEPSMRPYANVIHDNWANYAFNGIETAVAMLPGFDVPASESRLWYSNLTLIINRVYRWDAPPEIPDSRTQPIFSAPLDLEFSVKFNRQYAGTVSGLPGSIELARYITKKGLSDIDLSYELKQHVTSSIYVIEVRLSTDAENVSESDTVYVVLGPPGYKYQKSLMYLEKYLSENRPVVRYEVPDESSVILEFISVNLISILLLMVVSIVIVFISVRRFICKN